MRTAARVSRNVTFQQDFTKRDKNHIWCDGPVATILRNASFWYRTEEDGGSNGEYSWQLLLGSFWLFWVAEALTSNPALLLLDPPIVDNRLICY
jgi:hypothetical protein